MVVVTLQVWSGLCQSINHSHHCGPTPAMLLAALMHLYGLRNSAGGSGLFQSINHSHHCSPTQAMQLAFKPTGFIHLYGCCNSASKHILLASKHACFICQQNLRIPLASKHVVFTCQQTCGFHLLANMWVSPASNHVCFTCQQKYVFHMPAKHAGFTCQQTCVFHFSAVSIILFAFRFRILLLGPISPIPIFRYFDTQMSIFPIFQLSNVNISNNFFKQTLHQQQLLSTSNDNFVCCIKLNHYVYIIVVYI